MLRKLGLGRKILGMRLEGINAIVTGATGNLGDGIVLALARAGCDCVCQYNSSEEKAKELIKQVKALGQEAIAIQADLRDSKQIDEFFEEAVKFGQPGVLINSAAVFERRSLCEVTSEKAKEILDLNLVSPILLSKNFAAAIKSQFGETNETVGKIINIADVGGISGWAEYVEYCASKAGLIGATKAMAKEFAPMITVNAISPGIITWDDDVSEEEKKKQLKWVPAGRTGNVSDVAGAIIFLLENDYITGAVLNVDGGRNI